MNVHCKKLLFNTKKLTHRFVERTSIITNKVSNSNRHHAIFHYTTEQRGFLYDPSYRLYLRNEKEEIISPFHDISLHSEDENIYNMVVEVPRWSNAKMEVSTAETMNPIKQDEKQGNLRFVANCFPHHGYLWNYGCLPQTWEDPSHINIETKARGDGDPIDICEIGSRIHSTGSIIKVKLLGILCLIDEEETDWKIIGIDVNDPCANELRNVNDIERIMPGLLNATVQWYRVYKTPFGSPPNKFGFDEKIKDVEFTYQIINNVHQHWKNLMHKRFDTEIQRSCTTYDCEFKISQAEAVHTVNTNPEKGNPKPYNMDVNKWYYIN